MGASVTDLPDSVHIALESNNLPDAELMGNEDFVFTLFKLLVEFHYSSKGHKFKSLPRRSKAVVGVTLMMAMDYRIALEIRGIDLALEVAGVRATDNGRTYKPYRRSVILVREVVYERSTEGYLDAIEIAHEQQTQVKIEVVEIYCVLKRCALDVFVGAVAEFGIGLFKRKKVKAKAIIAYVK